jgi:phage gpG-like protein
MNIGFDIQGMDNIKKRINKLKSTYNNLSGPLKKVVQDFSKTESKVFNSQGAYGSRPRWTPLVKPELGSGRILVQSGQLRNSVINPSTKITKNSLTLNFKDRKFKFHQKGTRKMTSRPPVTITEYQKKKWIKIIRDDILKGL